MGIFSMFNKQNNVKYAKIINKGSCLSTINENNSFKWKNPEIREKSGSSEWAKYGFYPANEMVGIIVDQFENPMWNNHQVFVLHIDNQFFVAMHENGIEIISEKEYTEKLNMK